ncbi:MAG: hypothetical protein AABX91_01410 [Nanoarchaeota archaeon]
MKRGRMNKKGLDAIVTTIIIILLALVAIGIIWAVLRNVVQQGADQVDNNAKCISVDLKAVSVVPVVGQSGNYSVTLRRAAGGEAIGGVKVNIFNATANSGVSDFSVTLAPLDTKTQTVVGVTGANKIEYTAFFTDASGNEQACSQTGTFSF